MLNFWTYQQFDSKCLHLASINENDIKPQIRQAIINDKIQKVYGLLDGVNHPFWNKLIALTVAADQELLADNATNGGIITAIDSTAKTITRNTGTFQVGAIVAVTIVKKSDQTIVGEWLARITVGGATATYVKVGSGTEITFAGASHVCTVVVLKKLSTTSCDISASYVKKVVKVFDDQGTANAERVFNEYTDPVRFGNLSKDPFMTKEIGWYHRGATIELFVGSAATATGVTQAEVVGKPALFTDATATNLIDFPPEENDMVTDEVVAEFMRKTAKQLPADLQARLDTYKGRYDAAEASRQKAEETASKR